MKKIITLLIAAGAFVAVHAQTSRDEARRIILGGGNGSTSGPNSSKGRDIILGGGNDNNVRTYPNSYPNSNSKSAQIDQINREYDYKIYSIRNNGSLTRSEKERMIRQLEQDRERRIREIRSSGYGYSKGKGYSKRNRHDDDDDRCEGKHDNGKHKGWSNGKGNQRKGKD